MPCFASGGSSSLCSQPQPSFTCPHAQYSGRASPQIMLSALRAMLITTRRTDPVFIEKFVSLVDIEHRKSHSSNV